MDKPLDNHFVWQTLTPLDNNNLPYKNPNTPMMSILSLNHTFLLDNSSDTQMLTLLYPHSNLH